MSKTIDERVVSLQFDNKNFEKNAKDTMSTLDKLKKKLSFKGASKGLEEVNDAAKNVNMSNLEHGIDKVGLKFNWLHSIAHTALTRITNKVMDTGERLVKSLTVDPIKTGLSEYETQLNSVQTILANTESKGSTLKDVNRALDELNQYADQTIYNFTEMTRNIGTFTAAGVDLDTSVKSIKGIANLAAVSGSTSQQASTAMYQLSQALASGTVKLMDWNSVVNAGMGGEVFQDALKETARIHGVAIDDILKSQGSFRESLSEGWLTADILNETLEKFTMTTEGLSEAEIEANRVKLRNIGYTEEQIEKIFKLGNAATAAATKVKTASQMIDVMKESAQSGWSQTWEIIIGDFEEAKELWTMASDAFTKVIGESAEKRNKLLKDALGSGWDEWMDKGIMDEEGYEFHLKEIIKQNDKFTQGLKEAGLADSFAELVELNGGSLVKALRQGFQAEVITADTLSESLSRLTDAYSRCSDEELEAAGYTREQYDRMVALNKQFQNGELSAEDFANSIVKLSGRELIFDKELGILPNLFKSIYEIIKPIGNAWEAIFPSVTGDQIYNLLSSIQQKMLDFREAVTENSDKIFRTFRGLFSIIGMVWHVFKLLFGVVKKVASAFKIIDVSVLDTTASIGDFLYGLYEALTGSKKLTDTLDSVADALIAIGLGIRNFFKEAKGRIDTSGFTGFADTLKKVWEFIKKVFSSIANVIKSIAKSISESIDGTGINGVLDLLNAGLIAALLLKIKNLFSGFNNILEGFSDIMEGVSDTLSAFQQRVKASALKEVAIAIAILAGSILVISLINKDKLETALAAITMLFIELTVLMKTVGKSANAIKGGGSIIAIGIAMFLLGSTLKKLAGLGWDEILPAMAVMGTAIVAFIGTVWAISKMKTDSIKAFKIITIVTSLSLAMIPLSIAMRIIGKMNWEEIKKGLAVMGGAILGIIAITGLLSLLNRAGSKIKVKDSFNPIVNIATGLGDALKEIFKVVAQGAAIGMLAFAMLEIAAAIAILSSIPWEKMKYGLLGMSAAYVILMLSIKTLSKIDATKSIKNAFALVLLMVPMTTMALTLAFLSQFDWVKMITSLVTINLSLDVLVITLKRLSKMNPEGLGKKVISLLALLVPLAAMTSLLMVLGQMKFGTIIKGLLAMNVMLIILSTTLKRLSKITSGTLKTDVYTKGKGGIFSFFGTKTDLIQKASALLILAVAIGAMSGSLIILGNLKWTTIIKGLIAMAGVLLVLGTVSKILSSVGGGFSVFAMGALAMGLACLTAAAGVYLLAKGLNLIINSLGETINTLCAVIIESGPLMAKAVAVLLVSILQNLVVVADELVASLMQLIVNSIRSASEYIPEMADAFMDLLFGVVDKLIEYIPDIVRLVGKLLSKLFTAIFEEIGNVDSKVFVKIILGIEGMILIMKQLATLKKDIVGASIGAVGLVAVFSILIGLFGLIAQGVSKGFIKNALGLIKQIGAPDVILSLTLIGTLMSSLMVIAKKFKLTDKGSFGILFKMSANLAIFIGALIALYSVIGLLANINGFIRNIESAVEVIKIIGSPQVIGCLALISALMISINAAAKYLLSGKFNDMLKVAGNLAIFIGGLIVIFSVIGLLTLIDGYTDMIRNAAGILRIIAGPEMIFCLSALAALSILLSKVKINVANIAIGGAGIAIIIGEILAICTILGLLASIPGLIDKTMAGIEVIKLLGSPSTILAFGLLSVLSLVLGAFSFIAAGAIAGGAMFAAVIAELVVVCLALGALASIPDIMNLVQGGINVIKLLGDPDTIVAFGLIAVFVGVVGLLAPLIGAAAIGLAGLAGVIVLLTGVFTALGALYKIPGIVELISGGGKMLEVVGNAIGKFFGGIINGIADAATAGLPELGRRFSEFMTNLKPFLDGIKDVTPETAQSAKDLASALLVLTAGNLVDQLTDWLFGDQDLSKFGEDLAEFGKGVKAFNDEVTDIKPETIKAGAEAGKLLAEMASEMPREDGWWQRIIGKKDLESFGGTLQKFGEGVRLFGEETANVNPDAIKAGAEAGTQLAEMTNELSRTGGDWQEFWGEKDLGLFSTNMTELGTGIKSFATSIADVGAETVTMAAKSAIEMFNAFKKFNITDKSPIMKLKTKTLKNNLENITDAMRTFSDDVVAIGAEKVSGAAKSFTEIVSSIQEFDVTKRSPIMKTSMTEFSTKLNSLYLAINSFVSNMSTVNLEAYESGGNIVEHLINGVESMSTKLITSIKTSIESALPSIDAYYEDFYDTGMYLIEGFAAGIKESKYLSTQSAAAAAQAAKDAIDNTLGIESPSKELYKSGEYTIQGYTNALDDGQSDISKAGSSMGNRLLSVFNDYILRIQQMLDDGIEINPVIRPTLDLSYAEAGMARLNGMFGSSSVMARVDSISHQMSQNQNGSDNDDIVDAIGELGNRIENAQGDKISVGNITINDSDEDVAEAIKILVRKALLERRR